MHEPECARKVFVARLPGKQQSFVEEKKEE
jgi:hypothetical protein